MPEPSIPRTNVLGVGISAVDLPAAVELISGWIDRRDTGRYVCVRDMHGVMRCQKDQALRRIHNRAGLVTPDGMPMVWLSRLSGHRQVSRVYGPDLMLALSQVSARKNYRQYYFGGAPGVAGRLAERLMERFPGLQVAGLSSPPFRKLTGEEDESILRELNASQADIIWVGLSTPKQEHWMAEHAGKVNAPVLIGVGAAFDFLAGVKPQAPAWMRRSGLEWLFRLLSEPRRLWRRYLIDLPHFLILTLLQLTHLRRFPTLEED